MRWHWNTSEYKYIGDIAGSHHWRGWRTMQGNIYQEWVALILLWAGGPDEITSKDLLQLCFLWFYWKIQCTFQWFGQKHLFCFGTLFLNLNSQGKSTCSPLCCLKQLFCLHKLYEKLTVRGLFVCIAGYFRNADSFYQAEGVHTCANYHQINDENLKDIKCSLLSRVLGLNPRVQLLQSKWRAVTSQPGLPCPHRLPRLRCFKSGETEIKTKVGQCCSGQSGHTVLAEVFTGKWNHREHSLRQGNSSGLWNASCFGIVILWIDSEMYILSV